VDLGAFRNQLRLKKVSSAYLFTGSQDLLKAEALEELRQAVAGDRGTVRTFIAGETSAGAILEAQRNLSLLDPVAVIVIRNAAKLKGECEELAAELPSLPSGPPLVFWDESVDKRGGLFAAIARAGGEVEFEAPKRDKLAGWIQERAVKIGGHRIDRAVAEELAELVGDDLLALQSTLERLSIVVGREQPIGSQQVAEHVVSSRLHAFYELQRALAEKNALGAVALLRQVIDEGGEIPVIVGALVAEVRRLLIAREAPSGVDLSQRLASIGVPPFRVDGIKKNAQRFSTVRLRRAIEELADIDIGAKTGRGEPVAAIEQWLLSVCTEAPAGRHARRA